MNLDPTGSWSAPLIQPRCKITIRIQRPMRIPGQIQSLFETVTLPRGKERERWKVGLMKLTSTPPLRLISIRGSDLGPGINYSSFSRFFFFMQKSGSYTNLRNIFLWLYYINNKKLFHNCYVQFDLVPGYLSTLFYIFVRDYMWKISPWSTPYLVPLDISDCKFLREIRKIRFYPTYLFCSLNRGLHK